jgi:LmbE family N-acetylglucosaminyl deacetylase/glycosyltransferase involved in cell wall biosynthesis
VVQGHIRGFLLDRENPETVLSLQILIDGRQVACIRADRFSPVLEQQGITSPRHGFRYRIPTAFWDDADHRIELYEITTGQPLHDPPLVFHQHAERMIFPYTATDIEGQRVLVVAPHPDDETFGCGGSLIRHCRAGDPVKCLILTRGERGDVDNHYETLEYTTLRQQEARRASEVLGITDIEFWTFTDRQLEEQQQALHDRLRETLIRYRPEVIYAPSPNEVNPDHRVAISVLERAVVSLSLCVTLRLYEITPAGPVNMLVDITGCVEQKEKTIRCYDTQLSRSPYLETIQSLNQYRSLTLGPQVSAAEAFFQIDAGSLLVAPLGSMVPFVRLASPRKDSPPLVSIVVRTQNRRRLLRDALDSLCGQTYAPLQVVLVNDGGDPLDELVSEYDQRLFIDLIQHPESRGRATAGNNGLKQCRGKYIGFLDDDDILYPDHLAKLVDYLETTGESIAYSDCESGTYEWSEGNWRLSGRRKLFCGLDFDPERLYIDNFIPNMCILFSRSLLDTVGMLDHRLEVYEDWDLWLRFSQITPFARVPGVTAEYRFFRSNPYDFNTHRMKLFQQMDKVTLAKTYPRWLDRHMDALKQKKANLEQRVSSLATELETLEQIRHSVKNGQSHVPSTHRTDDTLHRPLKIAVFGFYKTGTTGLYHKILNSLDPPPRQLFEPRQYRPAPEDDERPVLAKVILGIPGPQHPVDYASFDAFKKIILVRDPRDWIISGALFIIQQEPALYSRRKVLNSILRLLKKKEKQPSSVAFMDILDAILSPLPDRSTANTLDWIGDLHEWFYTFERDCSDSIRVTYEDFIDGNLSALEAYLGMKLTGDARAPSAYAHVARTRSYGNWRHWFVPNDVEVLKPIFSGFMQRYGYTPDWTLADHQVISRRTCSHYVKSSVQKRRQTNKHVT